MSNCARDATPSAWRRCARFQAPTAFGRPTNLAANRKIRVRSAYARSSPARTNRSSENEGLPSYDPTAARYFMYLCAYRRVVPETISARHVRSVTRLIRFVYGPQRITPSPRRIQFITGNVRGYYVCKTGRVVLSSDAHLTHIYVIVVPSDTFIRRVFVPPPLLPIVHSPHHGPFINARNRLRTFGTVLFAPGTRSRSH